MKASNLRELTAEELQQRVEDTRKELFNLRLQVATSQLENPLQIRKLRRNIARLQTVLSSRKSS